MIHRRQENPLLRKLRVIVWMERKLLHATRLNLLDWAASFLELGIVERSSHEGHSWSDVHESDLLPEPEFLGFEDLSADVKEGGVYPTEWPAADLCRSHYFYLYALWTIDRSIVLLLTRNRSTIFSGTAVVPSRRPSSCWLRTRGSFRSRRILLFLAPEFDEANSVKKGFIILKTPEPSFTMEECDLVVIYCNLFGSPCATERKLCSRRLVS